MTGLSLAVLVGHVLNGAGALVFGLLSVGVIWTLHRLRGNAPGARTTADLISSVPGAAPARAVQVVQFSAYALIAAYSTTDIVRLALNWSADPDAIIPDWSVPVLCILVVGLAAAVVATLSTRLLALVATVLAAIALLSYFYVALAVIAKTASGAALAAPTMDVEASSGLSGWGPAATLVALAIVFAGFEIPTTTNHRLTSVRRPLGLAIALVAVCATTAWVASNMATAGDFRYEATDLVIIAADMFGQSTTLPLLFATIALTVAAILVLMWGAARVIRPANGSTTTPVPLATTAVVTGVLACILAIGFGDAEVDLWAVAGLLLLVVYVAAAHANSRLDDSSTTAWAWLVLTAIVLAVASVLTGASRGWWPVVVAIVIVAAASAWAIQSGKAQGRTPPAAKARPQSKSERLSRGNRTS